MRTWLIKFTSVSFDNSDSEAGWVHGTQDGRQGVPWQASASFVSHCIGLLIETSLLPVSIGPPIGIGGVCRALKGFYGQLSSLFCFSVSPKTEHVSGHQVPLEVTYQTPNTALCDLLACMLAGPIIVTWHIPASWFHAAPGHQYVCDQHREHPSPHQMCGHSLPRACYI